MKKLIFTLTIVLLSLSLNAQINIIEEPQPILIGSAKIPGISTPFVTLKKINDLYVISYKDAQYTHIIDYKYFVINTDETLQGFYDILIKQLDVPKKTELRINIDGSDIRIITNKLLGQLYLTLYVSTKNQPMGILDLKPKDINNLFGK